MENNDKRWSLAGKTALVTGGTRGIGYSINLDPILNFDLSFFFFFCMID